MCFPVEQATLKSSSGVVRGEEALLQANLQQLECTSAQAEEINLQLNKAVKFNRLSLCPDELLALGEETCAKLAACIRL